MNLALHNFKKDVRHLRVLLIIWFLLVGLQAAMSGSGITARADDMVLTAVFQTLSFLIPMLQYLVLLVMIPLLIHDEPLVGTTAFWFTRPISRKALLSSKSLFVGALLVLPPLFAEIVVLACNGITLRHILLAIPEILASRCVFVLIVSVFAVLTPSFARFAIVGVSFWVVVMLISWAVQIARLFFGAEEMLQRMADLSLTQSREVVTSIIILVVGVFVVCFQYLTRKTKQSVCVAIVGYLLVMSMQHLWTWNFMALPKVEVKKEIIDADSVSIAIDSDAFHISDTARFRSGEKRKKQIKASIKVIGLPAGYVAEPSEISSTLKFHDGKEIVTESRSSFSFSARSWDIDALQYALGEIYIINAKDRSYHSQNIVTLDEDDYDKYVREIGKLSLNVDLIAYRYAIAVTLPLKKNARYEQGSKETLITDVLKRTSGCTVMIRERTINLLFAADARPTVVEYAQARNVKYILCNKKRKEAFLPEEDRQGSFNIFGRSERLNIRDQNLRFNFGDNRFSSVTDEEWLANAELLCVEKIEVGHLAKTLTDDNFVIRTRGRWGTMPRSHSRDKEGPDEEALSKITLPENPTKQQVRSYVQAILTVSSGQRRYSTKDPQVAMLEKVGSENLEILIEADRIHGCYIQAAIKHLAGPEHKDLILKHLNRHHGLVEIVLEKGWVSEARGTLIEKLKTGRYLPIAWIKVVATFKDPTTYDDLKDYLINGNNRNSTYNAIKNLPGIDLADAVEKAWKRVKYKSDYELFSMVPAALDYGYLDALEMAVESLGTDESSCYNFREVRKTLKKHVDIIGTDKDIVEWYKKNKGSISFNPETRMFHSPAISATRDDANP